MPFVFDGRSLAQVSARSYFQPHGRKWRTFSLSQGGRTSRHLSPSSAAKVQMSVRLRVARCVRVGGCTQLRFVSLLLSCHAYRRLFLSGIIAVFRLCRFVAIFFSSLVSVFAGALWLRYLWQY